MRVYEADMRGFVPLCVCRGERCEDMFTCRCLGSLLECRRTSCVSFVCMKGGWKVVQRARKGWRVPLILNNSRTPCGGHQMKSTQVVHRGAGSSRFSAQVARVPDGRKMKGLLLLF